jgi:hypothetical protein
MAELPVDPSILTSEQAAALHRERLAEAAERVARRAEDKR